jgi:hypothetical protein
MPLKGLYAKLLSIGHIPPIYVPPLQPSFPIWYKLELTCEYHACNPRHGIETYYAFKKWLLIQTHFLIILQVIMKYAW